MKFYRLIVVLLFFSCTGNKESKLLLEAPKKAIINKPFKVIVKKDVDFIIDSLHYYLNDKRVKIENNSLLSVNIKASLVGSNSVTALIFYPQRTKKITKSVEVFADRIPKTYTYKLINSYPHDSEAYTQGLEYHDGFLYETTGQRGKSTLRKIDLKTGGSVTKIKLSDKYFGEGMSIYNDKIYWLTWQSRIGKIYDLKTFKFIKDFTYYYSNEGWGLTHNEVELIKSDGTHRIWFLDPKELEEKRSIQAYTNTRKVSLLNELEMIEGKIFANHWVTSKPIKSTIVIIDPKTGIVDGLINLEGLREEISKEQKLNEEMVLNGIAYDSINKRLFVTGKNWNRIFEIKIVPNNSK